MKTFNSFQVVCTFAGAPYAIGWLQQQTFPGAQLAMYTAAAAYFAGFIMMVATVRVAVQKGVW